MQTVSRIASCVRSISSAPTARLAPRTISAPPVSSVPPVPVNLSPALLAITARARV